MEDIDTTSAIYHNGILWFNLLLAQDQCLYNLHYKRLMLMNMLSLLHSHIKTRLIVLSLHAAMNIVPQLLFAL